MLHFLSTSPWVKSFMNPTSDERVSERIWPALTLKGITAKEASGRLISGVGEPAELGAGAGRFERRWVDLAPEYESRARLETSHPEPIGRSRPLSNSPLGLISEGWPSVMKNGVWKASLTNQRRSGPRRAPVPTVWVQCFLCNLPDSRCERILKCRAENGGLARGLLSMKENLQLTFHDS